MNNLARELLDVLRELADVLNHKDIKKGVKNFEELVESGKVTQANLMAYGLWSFNIACNFGGLLATIGIHGYEIYNTGRFDEKFAKRFLDIICKILKNQ